MFTVTARIEAETLKQLDALAQATHRSRSWLVADAIKRYVDEEGWQIAAIEEGVRQADAGLFVSPEEVQVALSRWGVNPTCCKP